MSNLQKKRIILMIGLFLFVGQALAQEFKRLNPGVRNLGMGNTGIALSFDEHALQYNPASLGGIDKIWVKIPLVVELSRDTINAGKTVEDGSSSDIGSLVEDHLGRRFHVRSSLSATFVAPLGGIVLGGHVAGSEAEFSLLGSNRPVPDVDVGFRIDKFQSIGLAFPIRRGQMLLGISYNRLERFDLEKTITFSNFLSGGTETADIVGCDPSKNCTFSSGQSVNLGFLYRLQTASALRMTIGISILNAGGMKFTRKDGEVDPQDVPQEVNIGISFQPFWNRTLETLVGIDYRDIVFDQPGESTICNSKAPLEAFINTDCGVKHIHFGVEFRLFPFDSGGSFLALRLGANQGYPTYGFEVNPFIIGRYVSIQFAQYTVEQGEIAGSIPETRQVAEVSFGF